MDELARAKLGRPLLGIVAAIGITTAMDASGLSALSALPLFPLLALGWYLERFSHREVGFVWGRPRHYGLALLYPVVVIGLVTAIAAIAAAVDASGANWPKVGRNLALVAVSTTLVATITEEGFFRGWLWASLRRAGQGDVRTLLLTSLAFSLWHVSAVSLDTGFDIPPAQIPGYLANAAVMGAAWGMLRSISGSVLVASLSHGVWNGMAYVLFGFGTKTGALGVARTAVFGPEVGVVGLVVNVFAVSAAWLWWRRRG